MENPEKNQISDYIKQMAQATTNGVMEWSDVNPTTLTWFSADRKGKIVVQRVDRQVQTVVNGRMVVKMNRRYLLQAIEGTTGVAKFSVDGNNEPELNPQLEELYGAASASIARKGLDFLKSIIPK